MTTSLSTTLTLQIQATLSRALDLDTAQDPLSLTRSVALSDGAGAGQADASFHDRRTLASAAGEDLDVAAGLTDAFGQAVALARVKALYLRNLSAGDALLVGGAAVGALGLFADPSDVLALRPGGILLLTAPDADGVPVAGSGKLRLEHSGDTGEDLDYEIVLIGASA